MEQKKDSISGLILNYKINPSRMGKSGTGGMMFTNFANRWNGNILSLDFCQNSSGILPSCEGHAVIEVSKKAFDLASCEASEMNKAWNNFGSIELVLKES